MELNVAKVSPRFVAEKRVIDIAAIVVKNWRRKKKLAIILGTLLIIIKLYETFILIFFSRLQKRVEILCPKDSKPIQNSLPSF